jgi:hypothetical protein
LILFGHDGRQWPKVTENVPFAPWAGR